MKAAPLIPGKLYRVTGADWRMDVHANNATQALLKIILMLGGGHD